MLISSLLNLIYGILSLLLVFNLPQLPDTVITIVDNIMSYVVVGIKILHVFLGDTCMGVIALLFDLVILFNAAYMLYSLVMWVLRKIPMLNIRE